MRSRSQWCRAIVTECISIRKAVRKFDGLGKTIQPENVLHSWVEVQKMFLDFKASTGKSAGTIDR